MISLEFRTFLNVGNSDIEASLKLDHSDIFNNTDLFSTHKHLSDYEIDTGAIFTCGGLSFALIWKKKSIFLFESHSRTSDGNQAANGQAILLKFAYTRDFKNFIITLQ